MMISIARVIAAGALMAPLMGNAAVYQFNASLNSANEVGTGSVATATGLATLSYNDFGTASLADDLYAFSMSVFGLTGGTTLGTAASGFHIHGAASTLQNATVRVNLGAAPFSSLNSGGTLLVGGANVAPPSIPATAPYPAMSFLAMLNSGLAYVNVHTELNPSGAVRGQLLPVAAVTPVPEPETYALLLAGLGLVGAAVRRRKAAKTT